MKKEIIINAALNETRIAITEDGRLAEFFIEMPDKERSVGNIYLGKVRRVVSGLNAAFVDIGHGQDAFLHFSDVDDTLENFFTDDDEADDPDEPDNEYNPDDSYFDELNIAPSETDVVLRKEKPTFQSNTRPAQFQTRRSGKVDINLEENQSIIVQIVREAYAQKGVKVTTRVALPGRYVVLLPFDNLIGISRKISSVKERKRLRFLAKTSLPKGAGCIIRTAAQGKSDKELMKDWEKLVETWTDVETKVKKSDGPGLIYNDMELATSVIRDLFTTDVTRVSCDSKKLYKEITTYLKWASPALLEKVELYSDKKSIFDHFGVEKELEATYKSKVNLPSGGTIIIEQTEAMFVVDVNSAKSISASQQEQSALNTNLEAVKEIARQIRLRDLAGMILIDCIDVNRDNNRKRIFFEMRKELGRDRAKTVVYPLTQLCILQITRQRINQTIGDKITETCPTCHGRGRIPSKSVLFNTIERWLKNFRSHSKEFRLILYIHPHVAPYLTDGAISRLSKLMLKYFVKIKLVLDEHIPIDQFKFESVRRQKDITQEYMKF